jgi:ABC-type transport system involved in Fe-S cluster assembly fused permease/ATPase subunit
VRWQQALDDLLETRMRGVTTLSIAHRLSTIHTANPIIVMHNGRVEEVGDHASLVAARGR